MRIRAWVALAAVLVLATAACSSDTSTPATGGTTSTTTSTSSETSSEPPEGGEVGQLSIVDFAFEPSAVQAGEGGELTITNDGDTTHTFTMDDGSIDEELEPGATVDVIIGEAGSFHCEIHASMTGTIETE